jgi:hypothetical protein
MATDDFSQHSFGVYKPEGHVVMSFATAEDADAAAAALSDAGVAGAAGDASAEPTERSVRRFSDREMLEQAESDIARASPLANLGQELNLVKAQRDLAKLGYHFLAVKADDDEHARSVAAIGREHGAERGQYYGRFIVEELIEHPTDTAQVAESPDRGLDAQTPSGEEEERARLRPADE